MRNFAWNRFSIKSLARDSLLTPIVESVYFINWCLSDAILLSWIANRLRADCGLTEPVQRVISFLSPRVGKVQLFRSLCGFLTVARLQMHLFWLLVFTIFVAMHIQVQCIIVRPSERAPNPNFTKDRRYGVAFMGLDPPNNASSLPPNNVSRPPKLKHDTLWISWLFVNF